MVYRQRYPRAAAGLSLLLMTWACSQAEPAAMGQPGGSQAGASSGLDVPGASEGDTSGTAGGTEPTGGELPGDQLFSQREVLHFSFTLDEASWRQLEEHGNAEEYLEAGLEFQSGHLGAQQFATVGLRHKGSWTLHHCWDDFGGQRSYAGDCAKLSLKVKFDKYDSRARLDGLKRLNLHAMQTDPVKLRELLGYSLFRDFGVPAPRVLPAQVTVNGELLGMFMAVEAIDGRFTTTHFPRSADGNLYKETWPHASFDDAEYLDALRTNEERGDVSGMLAFARAVNEATPASFEETVGAHLDIEHTLRYLAVDRAIRNWDGITGFYQPEKPHNFYWYHDEGDTGRFLLVPWDLDNVLDRDWFMDPPELFGVPPLPDWNQAPRDCVPRPVWEPDGPVSLTPPRCDALLDLLATERWPRFVELGRELLRGPFTREQLQARVDGWLPLIEPLIEADPLIDLVQWQGVLANWREQTLPQLVTDFEGFLEQGLIEEPPAPPAFEPAPPEAIATTNSGFDAFAVNGFEFTDGVEGEPPEGIAHWTDERSSANLLWNTSAPIDGAADLRIDLNFVRIDGAWNEYVGVGYYGATADVSDRRYLVVSMAADPPRRVRIALASPLFEEEFGGAWSEFSVDLAVEREPKEFGLPLSAFTYAEWAREAWESGQGWSTSDEEAKLQVLQNLNGVIFNPQALSDPAGELVDDVDVGWFQIDRIYLQ